MKYKRIAHIFELFNEWAEKKMEIFNISPDI